MYIVQVVIISCGWGREGGEPPARLDQLEGGGTHSNTSPAALTVPTHPWAGAYTGRRPPRARPAFFAPLKVS